MENIIKQLKNAAKNTRLSPAEKAAMKSALVEYVKAHPVGSIPSPFVHAARSPFSINNFRNKKGLSGLVIAGLLMSGTVSFAAENTVPGDVLYSVKLNVNERVRGAVAVTPKAKADWDVRLVERRLQEVERLAVNPEVRPEVKKLAEDNLERYTERVKARIAKFEDDEDGERAIETASGFSDILGAHEQALEDLDVKSAMSDLTSTSTQASTSTPATDFVGVEEESIKDTIKKVRDAHGDAEKKHKELKEKYNKDKADGSEQIDSTGDIKSSGDRRNKDERSAKEVRKEELRSSESVKPREDD